MTTTAAIARRAADLIDGPRAADHGPAEKTFADIAVRWSQRFGVSVTSPQVAACMIDLKLVRIMNGKPNPDDWTDAIGYSALGGSLAQDSQSDQQGIAEAIASQRAAGMPIVDMSIVRAAAAAPIVPPESTETPQDAFLGGVGGSEVSPTAIDPSESLWRPEAGKFGKTRDGRLDENKETPHDLIREVPAPAEDTDELDPVAIYEDDPARLIGSVWRKTNNELVLDRFEPFPNLDGKIVFSGGGHRWSVPSLKECGYTLVSLAPQSEAAE